MSAPIVGPIKGIVQRFDLQTFGEGNTADSMYRAAVQVTDKDAITALLGVVNGICEQYNVDYPNIDRPPVVAADKANIEGVDKGVVVFCKYRLDSNHMSPYTLDGTRLPPEHNTEYDRKMEAGRVCKIAVKFAGASPTVESVQRGNFTIKAKPAGAVYCDLIAIMPMDEIVAVKTDLDLLSGK